jgi:hypothetical protein
MDNYKLNVYLAILRLYENLPIYNVGMAYRTPNNKLDIDDYLIATITMAILIIILNIVLLFIYKKIDIIIF